MIPYYPMSVTCFLISFNHVLHAMYHVANDNILKCFLTGQCPQSNTCHVLCLCVCVFACSPEGSFSLVQVLNNLLIPYSVVVNSFYI